MIGDALSGIVDSTARRLMNFVDHCDRVREIWIATFEIIGVARSALRMVRSLPVGPQAGKAMQSIAELVATLDRAIALCRYPSSLVASLFCYPCLLALRRARNQLRAGQAEYARRTGLAGDAKSKGRSWRLGLDLVVVWHCGGLVYDAAGISRYCLRFASTAKIGPDSEELMRRMAEGKSTIKRAMKFCRAPQDTLTRALCHPCYLALRRVHARVCESQELYRQRAAVVAGDQPAAASSRPRKDL